jgi:hypothetical protein
MAIKRSMNPGFAGIENELYTLDRTLMLFGDAKNVIGELKLLYNKTRQAAITKELSEIVAGAAAV